MSAEATSPEACLRHCRHSLTKQEYELEAVALKVDRVDGRGALLMHFSSK
jgi:hypothetical protein